MALHNAKPRFAFDDEQGLIYDYGSGQFLPTEGTFDGWDLALLKQLILAGVSVEAAFKGAPNTAGTSFIFPGVTASDAPAVEQQHPDASQAESVASPTSEPQDAPPADQPQG